jgi:hypothetical protein
MRNVLRLFDDHLLYDNHISLFDKRYRRDETAESEMDAKD